MNRDTFPSEFLFSRSPEDLAQLNRRFLEEATLFALEFECEHCEHWNPDGALCSMGYPSLGLRTVRGGDAPTGVVLEGTGHTQFCKHFESI